MGATLSIIKSEQKPLDSSFLFSLPISQIREQWMQFRMLCDGFWIDFEVFHKIFRESQPIFHLWDFQESALIDALELFSCLILFSKAEFPEKIKFIFEIYDFNDLHSLSIIDLEYIVNCCLCSILRVFKCGPEHEPEQDRISHLVNENFKTGERVNISQFLRFGMSNSQISEFMQIIGHELPRAKAATLTEQIERTERPESIIPEYLQGDAKATAGKKNEKFEKVSSGQVINSNHIRNKNKAVATFLDKIQNFAEKSPPKETKLRLNWVYGFRFKDVVHSLVFDGSSEGKARSTEGLARVVYSSFNQVVVYYYKVNKQMVYNEHANPVSAVTVSQDGTLCATGEEGVSPKIHVWSIADLRTRIQLSGISNSAIYLLKFVKKDKWLVAVTKRPQQPLHIFDLMSGSTRITFSLDCFLSDFVPVFNLLPKLPLIEPPNKNDFGGFSVAGSFFAFTTTELHLFTLKSTGCQYLHRCLKIIEASAAEDNAISSCCAVYANTTNPEIAIYRPLVEQDLMFIIGQKNGKLVQVGRVLQDSAEFEKKELKSFHSAILHLVFVKKRFVCVLTANSVLHLYDFALKTDAYQVPLNGLELDIASFEIKNMEPADDKSVFLVTSVGEIVKVSLKEKLVWDDRILKSVTSAAIVQGIYPLPPNSRAVCLLDLSADERYIFLGGGDNIIYTLSSSQHKVVDKWLAPEPMTCIDAIFNKALGIMNAIGTMSGKVLIRLNWNKVLETFECKTEVIALKFSESGKILIVSTKNSLVFVFTRKNGLYFKTKEDSFRIPNEIVVTINFNDNCARMSDGFVILGTNTRNHYTVSLGLKDHYQPIFSNSQCNSRQFALKFAVEGKEDFRPVAAVSSPFLMFSGESFGIITVYDSKDNFENKLTGFYYGHSGAISSLFLSPELTYLYSLSETPGELFEWKIEIDSEIDDFGGGGVTNYYYQAHDSTMNQVEAVSNVFNEAQKSLVEDDLSSQKEEKSKNQFLFIKKDTLEEHSELLQTEMNDHRKSAVLKSSTSEIDKLDELKENDRFVDKQIQKVSNIKSKYAADTDSLAYFRSFINTDLRKLFIDRAHISTEDKDAYKKTFPEHSLKLKYVYGMSSYEFKNVCFYLHTPSEIMGSLNEDMIAPKPNAGKRKSRIADQKWEERTEPNPEDRLPKRKYVRNSLAESSDEKSRERGSLLSQNQREERSVGRSSRNSQLLMKSLVRQISTLQVPQNKLVSGGILVHEEIVRFLKRINSNQLSSFEAKDIQFSKMVKNYGRCEQSQRACRREILYVTSRIAIITDPLKIQTQRFYESHKSQISTVALHPVHKLAASGEIAFRPKIHVWNTTFCFNVAVIDTFHEKGILLVDFFVFENYLVSVSVDTSHSIQISDWKKGSVVAFRNASFGHILSAKTDPLVLGHFCTGSLEQVDFWEIKSQNILHNKSVYLHRDVFRGYVNTLTFIVYQVNKTNKSDLLVTSSHGQIGMINNCEFVAPNVKMDKNIVNVVRLVYVAKKPYIFVGCEDGWLKGYTLSFEKVFEWKETDRLANPKIKTRGIQSLDFYLCDRNAIMILAMTRDGKLFEFELEFLKERNGKGRFIFRQQEKNKDPEKGESAEKLLIQAHSAQTFEGDSDNAEAYSNERKKIFIALNREREIMASVGDDEYLFIWDVKTKAPLKVLPLQAHPTAIKFAPNNRLLIGFANGKVRIYDLEIMTSFDLGNNFSVVIKEHPFVISDPEISTAVLNMELSEKGERLAISYDISRVEHEVENRRKENGGFVVSVYQMRTKQTTSTVEVGNPYKPFDELRPSILNQFEMSKILCQNMAVHFMGFSEDFVHLVIYLQKMSDMQIRNNNDQDGQYIIRNVTTQQIHNAADNGNMVSLKSVNFPSHVYGIRLLADLNSTIEGRQKVPDMKEIEELANNKIILSAICDCDKICVMGSTKGEVFLARSTIFSVGAKKSPIEYPLTEMVQAKTYPAHISFVNQVEVDYSGKYVFTTGISDECVYQWEIEKTEEMPDQESLLMMNGQTKFCHDIPSKSHFMDLVRIVYPARNLITRILTNKDSSVVPRLRLDLHRVIGRKAMIRRSNVLVSLTHQLVYPVGTMLVVVAPDSEKTERNQQKEREVDLTNEGNGDLIRSSEATDFLHQAKVSVLQPAESEDEDVKEPARRTNPVNSTPGIRLSANQLRAQSAENLSNTISLKNSSVAAPRKSATEYSLSNQTFILPNVNRVLHPPSEIACMEMSLDKKTLCIGVNDSVAALYTYDITSLSFVNSVFLENCRSPIFVRFSIDSRFLFCCGLDADYAMTVYFIEATKMSVMAVMSFLYSVPYIFRDGMFFPSRNDEFVLVGPSQVASWKYCASYLTFKQLYTKPVLNSAIEKKFENENKDSHFDTMFISMQFVYPTIFVAGSSTGFLYLWRNEVCEAKSACYRKLPVTVIALSPNANGEFLTGGFGSNLKYFRVAIRNEKTFRLECVFEVELLKNAGPDFWNEPRFQLQSLVFKSAGQLILGFRDGSIDTFLLNAASMEKVLSKNAGEFNNEDSFVEPEKIKVVSQKRIANFFDDKYLIAADFSFDCSLVYVLTSGNVVYVTEVNSLRLLRTLTFEGQGMDVVCLELLILLQLETEVIAFDPLGPNRLPNFYYRTTDTITMMRVDGLQKYMCLALKSEKTKQDYVEIFKIEINGFVRVYQSQKQQNRITIIDFSEDSESFMFRDAAEKNHVFQLGTDKVDEMGDDFDYHSEWSADGLKISANLEGMRRFYSDENLLVDVLRVGKKSVLATDELGTVTLVDPRFRVPLPQAGILSGLPAASQ